MPHASQESFTVRILRTGSSAPVGVGFVVGDRHIVTCAHVVNAALGRKQHEQDRPDPDARVQVDFPMLGDAAGAPERNCIVEAWVPPPRSGVTGGDVAGLVVVGDGLPQRAGIARVIDPETLRDVPVRVFGCPGDPPRRANGAWSDLRLRGAVGGGVIQLDTDSESAIRAQPGYSGSPVIVSDGDGDAVLGILAVASPDGDSKDAYAIPVSALVEAWPDVLSLLTIPKCPYRGLEPFTGADAGVFVGREAEISQLRETVRRQALVVVTGPSGVGKSSLVNAGLLPALPKDAWVTGSFRPGAMPVHALARALAVAEGHGAAPTQPEVDAWAERVRSMGLKTVGSHLAVTLGKSVLLHADQLEDILDPTSCPPDLKAEFLELLLSTELAPGGGLHVVGTLRADFWTQLLEHPDAGARLHDRWFGLSPMGRERLHQVIAEPARARRVQYQEGLVALIADDAGGGPGLPLLEFALTQLWPHQRKRQITLADYQHIGRVTGALRDYAERVYSELLEQFSEDQIHRVMLALVRSRGGSAEATRRLVTRERLGTDWPVARELAKRRLVVVDYDAVKGEECAQITHESLILEWPLLAGWVDDDADFQHWVSAMEERAAEGDLLPDTRLAEADRWLAERANDVPPEVERLVKDSKSAWSRRVAELEDARKRAEDAAREADAHRLAAAAEHALASRGVSLQIPIALAVESLRMAPLLEANIAARHAVGLAARQISRLDHGGTVTSVAFSPDGRRVATGSTDNCARVLDAGTGAELCRLNHAGTVAAVAFSPDGTRVATGSWDNSARVFDAATGTELCRLDHGDTVAAVAFSPDGLRVVSGSWDNSARVFDAATGAELCRLDHRGPVVAVAFSRDGTRMATGSRDGGARVFDAGTRTELGRLGHGDTVAAVAFSPDGHRVASGSWDGSTRVFDAATGIQRSRLNHGGTVNSVAFSPDGTRVATGSADKSAWVFDADTGIERCHLNHAGSVDSVAFSPDGSRVATASADNTARVFDAAVGVELCRLDHDDTVVTVAFSPDGTRVATGSRDYSARVFDTATGTELSRPANDGTVVAVAFSPDGTRVAVSSRDHSTRVFDAATGAGLCRLRHDGTVVAVAFSPDGTRVAISSRDHSTRVFDAATGAELCRLRHDDIVKSVVFSPDGTRAATVSADEKARVFDVAVGTEPYRLRYERDQDGDHDGKVVAVVFSPDGTRVATGSWDGSALVFDAVTGAGLGTPLNHAGSVDSVVFSPDGTRVATGSADYIARVFDAATGAELCRLRHGNAVNSVVFSPDGARVATASADESARVFDAATGAEMCHLNHGGAVVAVVFSPDGTRVATGSADHSARVFDAATGAELCRLHHEDIVDSVVFSPDGARVATGSRDGSARVWIVDHGQLIKEVEGRLTRNLTEQEWRRFFRDEPYRKTRADLP